MLLESEYALALEQGRVLFSANNKNLDAGQSVELIIAADEQHDVYITSSSIHSNVASGQFRTFIGEVADLSNMSLVPMLHVNLKFLGQDPVGVAVYESADIAAEQALHNIPLIGLSNKQSGVIPVDAGIGGLFAIVPAGKFMRVNVENTDDNGDMNLTVGVIPMYRSATIR